MGFELHKSSNYIKGIVFCSLSNCVPVLDKCPLSFEVVMSSSHPCEVNWWFCDMFFFFFFTGQGLSHDIQHIPPSLMVDGAWPRLPSNTSARFAHCPWWPPCHHCLWLSSGLPVHRGVEFSCADPAGCTYHNTHRFRIWPVHADLQSSANTRLKQ